MKYSSILCMLLCAAMLMGLIAGCGTQEPVETQASAPVSQSASEEPKVEEDVPVKGEPTLVPVDSKEAVTAVLAEDTVALAEALPAAAWNALPVWNGVTLSNMHQYDWEPFGQPQIFSKEDVKSIVQLGFNFIRVPLDTRLYFDLNDPSRVRLDRLLNLDDLISWCAEFGIHLCPDVHFGFGFSTDEDPFNDTIWENSEEQELFVAFWNLLATRYKDVPSNLLSFNLMNEPSPYVTEEDYAALMRRAMSAIREHTPERLIFVDMLMAATEPAYSLVGDKAAQSFHFYEPAAMTDGKGSWPMYNCGGFIEQESDVCGFGLEGGFPAGTTISFTLNSIHGDGTLIIEADGENIYEWGFGKDAVGENGCAAISEEGTGGEYRDYPSVEHRVTLAKDTSNVEIYTEGSCGWFGLDSLNVTAGEKRYCFQPLDRPDLLPEGTTREDSLNPHIVFYDDGSVSDDGDLYFSVVDKEFISRRFAELKAFSEETGVAVMLQEFGVRYEANYDDTLAWFDNLLTAANENELNWCGWDYFGAYSFFAVNDELRQGATYEPFSYGMIATELYDVFKSHLLTGK